MARLCIPKVQHENRMSAEMTIVELLRKGEYKKPNRQLNVYLCPHCGFWHVGHSKKVTKRQAKYYRGLK